jgi:hypothetical protein
MYLKYIHHFKKWIIYRNERAIAVGDTVTEAVVDALIVIKK